MITTSLKIPEELKQRAVDAAQRQGLSSYVFMIGAIEQTVLATEQRASFIAEALAAEQEMLEGGPGYATEDVHRYIKARIVGEKSGRRKAMPTA